MSDTPKIELGYLDAIEAARYLGVSRSYFLEHIRRHVAEHDFRAPGSQKPMPKYTRADLDEWATKRRRKAAS